MVHTVPLFPLSPNQNLTDVVNLRKELWWLKVEKIALHVLYASCNFAYHVAPLCTGMLSFNYKTEFFDRTLRYPKTILISITIVALTILLFKGPSIRERINEINFYCAALSQYQENPVPTLKNDVTSYLHTYRKQWLREGFDRVRKIPIPTDRNSSEYFQFNTHIYQFITTQFVPKLINCILEETPGSYSPCQLRLLTDMKETIEGDELGFFVAHTANFDHVWPTKKTTLILIKSANREIYTVTYKKFYQLFFNPDIKNFEDFYTQFKSIILRQDA